MSMVNTLRRLVSKASSTALCLACDESNFVNDTHLFFDNGFSTI